MTRARCSRSLPVAELVDYLLGELSAADERRLEEHYFGCEVCARRLEAVDRLTSTIAPLTRGGHVSACVTAEVLRKAVADGVQIREYALKPGRSVMCTAAPEDDFVVVRLAGPFATSADLTLEVRFEDLNDGSHSGERRIEISADRAGEEVILLFSGEVVRNYPRSRWTMQVAASGGGSAERVGPYVMNHTPWEELV